MRGLGFRALPNGKSLPVALLWYRNLGPLRNLRDTTTINKSIVSPRQLEHVFNMIIVLDVVYAFYLVKIRILMFPLSGYFCCSQSTRDGVSHEFNGGIRVYRAVSIHQKPYGIVLDKNPTLEQAVDVWNLATHGFQVPNGSIRCFWCWVAEGLRSRP